jgi:spore coat protein U-like protein
MVSLSVGTGIGASYSGGRKMTRIGGTQTIIYNLFSNSSRTRLFGDGTGGSRTLTLSNSRIYSQPIWGRIFGGQPLTLPGDYLDTVIVTVSY